jgi:predicted ATP-grasp superfamily ATP-dependent carboligase
VRLLLAGLTARAMAESAVRAGCDVVTVDYFGDLDTKRLCPNASLRERGSEYSAAALVRLAQEHRYDAVAYGGGLENHPESVEALASGKLLLGNAPATLRAVRDPAVLFAFLAARRFLAPTTLVVGEGSGSSLPGTGRWLLKPISSGGGHGIRLWHGDRPRARHVLQQYLAGIPGSAVFVADGRQATLLGWSEQLHAPSAFRYGGNLFPLDVPGATVSELRDLVQALTERFGLVGLNGIDFVLQGSRPAVVEVNPRYSASMELVERATGVSMLGLHVAACRGDLPDPAFADAVLRDGGEIGVHGKAIVYARRSVTVTASLEWLERGVRDVPHPGDTIEKGRPICTVLARATSRADCVAALRTGEERILAECAPSPRVTDSDGEP